MVVPIIAGAGILGFLTWGKDLFGPKMFKQILTGGIIITLAILGYIGYKLYVFQEKIKKDPVGTIFEGAEKVKKEVKYISGATLSGLLGGGTSREGYETVQEVFVRAPQKAFDPGVLHKTPTEKGIKVITDVLNLTPQEYILTDCDRLVAGNEAFMSPETIAKKRKCEAEGYKDTKLRYW